MTTPVPEPAATPQPSSVPKAPVVAVTPAVPAAPPARKPKPSGLPANIVFYCKDCEKIGEVNRVGARYVYTCNVCGTKNVAFGTLRSLRRFFHMDERERKRAEKEAAAAATAARTK